MTSLRFPRALAASLAVLLAFVALPAPAQADDPCDSVWCCYQTPLEIAQAMVDKNVEIVNLLLQQWQLVAGKAKCTALETVGICSSEGVPGVSEPNWLQTTGSTGPLHTERDSCAEYYLPTSSGPPGQPFCKLPSFYVLHEQYPETPFTPAVHRHTCKAIGT